MHALDIVIRANMASQPVGLKFNENRTLAPPASVHCLLGNLKNSQHIISVHLVAFYKIIMGDVLFGTNFARV